MSILQKRLVSVGLICVFMSAGAAVAVKEQNMAAADRAQETIDLSVSEAYRCADTDLTFWYEDAEYTDFFETAAVRYFEKTGIKAAVQLQNDYDYVGRIHDATMEGETYPDVYLISGDCLEEVYLYGLAAVNDMSASGQKTAQNAVKASTYQDKQLGYPLSYNVCVFIYQNNYFETVPESLQSFIDYSDENEPEENVAYLLEWDINDAFYDFPFISNSVSFEKTEPEVMKVVYDETLYQKNLDYFEEILSSFSVDAETVSEESIISNFRSGRTLAAIIDTNSLCELDGYEYSLMQIPDLNDELPAYSCAATDMLIVNDFSKNDKKAADFAQFVTSQMAGELYSLSGHYSVIPSENPEWTEQVAYDAYEAAVPAPDSQDARDFWVSLRENISKYF